MIISFSEDLNARSKDSITRIVCPFERVTTVWLEIICIDSIFIDDGLPNAIGQR